MSLADWQPHLLILDMDLDGRDVLTQIGANTARQSRLPVIGLTRRGDLKAKLAAFEAGVDDILTIPFAPEELLARVIAVLRRSYSDAVTFTPVIKLGDLEIDILNRTVRAGTSELHLTFARAESAVFIGGKCWTGGDARRNSRHPVGRRLRSREQRGRPADPQPACAAPERLAQAAVHRDSAGPRIPVPDDDYRL